MPHENDPKPRDPNAKTGEKPHGEEVPIDLPEVADVDAAAESGVSFDLPPAEGQYESHTMGVSFADLSDIPEFADLLSTGGPTSGVAPIPVESLTPIDAAAVVDADDLVPIADAVAGDAGSSSSHLPRIDPPSVVKFDSSTKLAGLSGAGEHIPVAGAADSSVMANLEPLDPVLPASGWFDSHPDASLPFENAPVAEAASSSGLVGDVPPAQVVESSDIFGAGPNQFPAADLADVSDVIAATMGQPGKTKPVNPDDVPFGSNRPSDVALSFNEPPGGSTVADAAAAEELPLAEVADDEIWDVPAAEAVNDSAKLADAPALPDARHEAPDFGATPAYSADASSILGELGGPSKAAYDDASGVRIEDPGMSGTLHEPLDLTKYGSNADVDLTADLNAAGGSDVLGAPPSDHGRRNKGRADPFSNAPTDEQSSLSSGQSSIFSGGNKPAPLMDGTAEVPLARPDPEGTDAVDFSDHPDIAGADSGSFHGSTPAAGLADDSDMIDWSAAEGHPEASMSGPVSGILSGKGKPPKPDDHLAGTSATRPARPVAAIPSPSDPSIEVDWVADPSTEAAAVASAKPPRGRKRDRDDDRASPARPAAAPPARRGLDRVLGLALGVIVGTGACAALYLTGTIPNGSKTEPAPTAAVNNGNTGEANNTKSAAEIAALTADLKTANEKVSTAEKELRTQTDAAASLDKDLKGQKDAAQKAEKELMASKVALANLQEELKADKAAALTLETDLKKAKDSVAVLEKEAKTEKAKAEVLDKDLKAQQLLVKKLEKEVVDQKDAAAKLDADYKAKLKETNDLVLAAEKAGVDRQAALDAVARELQAKKLLPEKYDAKALLAATKDAAERATGPNLSTLFPPGMAALGGGPLTAGQLLDIADRLGKAEAAAKALKADLASAGDKYDADTKKLKDAFAAEMKKLTDAQAAEMKAAKEKADADAKKAADTYAANVKKLNDEHAAELKKATDANAVEKLKEAHAAELKKAADKFADDKKKLLADNEAAAKKLQDDYAAGLKKAADENAKTQKLLEAAVAAEKDRVAALTKKFEADLGNAVSPAQSLDQWLTILTGLRRPADADPAIAAANKVLATSPPGSEDAAKAQTVRGLALLIKGDNDAAKTWFTQAKGTPAYKDAAGKAPWAKAADLGLASVADPLAPLRRPVEKVAPDKAVAAKYLDAGINAYKAGRYAEAEKHLIQAAWNDDANPLAYYFLGAARWALGETDQAKKDFADGGTREKARTVSARSIDLAINPIQGAARDALAAARP